MTSKFQKSLQHVRQKVRGEKTSPAPLEITGNGPLCSLPPEILVLIAQHLPPSSLAILTLCSKALRYKLGAKYNKADIKNTMESFAHKYPPVQYFLKIYWTYHQNAWTPSLTPNLPELKMFLYLLARDSTSEIFCFRCERQHSPNKSDWVTPWRPWSWGNCESLDGHYLRYYYGRYFHFERAQLAMQKHRRGISPKKEIKRLTDLSSIPNSSSGMWPDMRTLRSVEAKIISNRLYIKAVRTRDCTDETSGTSYEKIRRRLYICPHLLEIECIVRNIIDGCSVRDGPHQDESKIDASTLSQCKYCLTEMRLEFLESKKLFSNSRRIVVTTWQDFGNLSHPSNSDWVAHLATEVPYSVVKFPLGSIRNAFEGTSPEGWFLKMARRMQDNTYTPQIYVGGNQITRTTDQLSNFYSLVDF